MCGTEPFTTTMQATINNNFTMKFLLKTRTCLAIINPWLHFCTDMYILQLILQRYVSERRHGSKTRVPGHTFLAWHSIWQMVMYIYYITAAVNSVSSQLGSSRLGDRYSAEKAGGAARPSRTKSHRPNHSPPVPGGPPCWASPLAIGLIGMYACWCRDAPYSSYLHFIH